MALIRTGRWQTAARLLAHLDRTYDDYGWTPLEDRLPVTAELRTAIADGLARGGLTVDYTPLPSAAMAAELVNELVAISAHPSLRRAQTVSTEPDADTLHR